MADCLGIYSPSEVTLLLAGIYEVDGYASDSSISFTKNTSYYSSNVGSNGSVERVHSADRTYTLEVSLAQTSPSNTVLTALASLDDASKSMVFPIYAKDSSGQSLFTAAWCYITDPPTASYTGSIETRVWRINCTSTIFGLAGNTTEENILQTAAKLSTHLSQFSARVGGIF